MLFLYLEELTYLEMPTKLGFCGNSVLTNGLQHEQRTIPLNTGAMRLDCHHIRTKTHSSPY